MRNRGADWWASGTWWQVYMIRGLLLLVSSGRSRVGTWNELSFNSFHALTAAFWRFSLLSFSRVGSVCSSGSLIWPGEVV